MTAVVRSRRELAVALTGSPRVLVPTMGALHAGHARLIARARELAGSEGQVVVSIFVNPLQFNDAADLAAYPVSLEADVELALARGADVVWHPGRDDVFVPGEPVPEPDPGPLGGQLEGASRPGHFAGVLAVVSLLFDVVRPDLACFGEKDYQQLVLVRRLAASRGSDVEVVAVPTVRDHDGLALSSRNGRLTTSGRAAAAAIPLALTAAAAGPGPAAALLERARARLVGLDVDYLELRAEDLGPTPTAGAARLLVAAVVDGVRLIDNVPVTLTASDGTA